MERRKRPKAEALHNPAIPPTGILSGVGVDFGLVVPACEMVDTILVLDYVVVFNGS